MTIEMVGGTKSKEEAVLLYTPCIPSVGLWQLGGVELKVSFNENEGFTLTRTACSDQDLAITSSECYQLSNLAIS